MGRCRVVAPEMARLEISDGDWIDVKKRLNYGEKQKMLAAFVKEMRGDGRVTPDMEMVNVAQILAYLVDWSLVDTNGKQIAIDTDAKKHAGVKAQDPATIEEISKAIEQHIEAMEVALADTKKSPAIESASLATS
jgi:hypothetical protein